MFARLLLFLYATHAACWSVGPSLVPQEQFKPTTTATELLNDVVQQRGLHIAHQVILVHPSDDLVSVLSYAAAGDVLLLANGVYKPEATDASALVIGKNITIAAQQTGQAVLDGQGKRRVLEITNGHVLLKGLNITNGSTDYGASGGGIYIEGGTLNIDNSQISSNTATIWGGGAYLSKGTATNFSNCSIAGNQAGDNGGGIYAEQGARVQLDDRSAVQSNKPDGCYGFWSSPACNKQ